MFSSQFAFGEIERPRTDTISRVVPRPSKSGRQDLNLRPLGPEISGAGSHRVARTPTAAQVAGSTRAGSSSRSYPVASDRPSSIGSCTFSAQNPESVPQFLTVREVAERLRVCRATVYRMVDEGRLPAVRVSSGAVRIRAEALA